MQLVTGTSDDDKGQMIAYWLSQMLGKQVHPPFTALGWLDKRDSLIGAAIFNGYNGANIEVTVFGPRALNRQALREGFAYVFSQLGCLRLTARCARSNKRMSRLFPRLGFTFEGTMSRYFGPERKDDALLYRMMRPEAQKWLTA